MDAFEFNSQKKFFNYSLKIPYFFPSPRLLVESNTASSVGYMKINTHTALRHAFLSPVYLFSKTNVLENLENLDKFSYRLADSIYHTNTKNVNIEAGSIIENYPGSIAAKYLFLSGGASGRIDILQKLVSNHKLHVEPYLTNTSNCVVTIHLRLGDVIELSDFTVKDHLTSDLKFTIAGYVHQYVYPFSYFEKILTEFFPVATFPNVELVTGTHRPSLGTLKTEEYISTLKTWITERLGYECRVVECTGRDADMDFLYMCHVPNFVPTGGGFSKLIEQVRTFSNTTKKFQFVHVCKSGGTVFGAYLSRHFPSRFVCGDHDVKCRKDRVNIIIVRDVEDRFISSFKYWCQGSELYGEKNRNQTQTLEDYVEMVRCEDDRLLTHYTSKNHYAPTSGWIGKEASYKNLIIVRYEKNMANKMRTLLYKLFGISACYQLPPLNHQNVSKKKITTYKSHLPSKRFFKSITKKITSYLPLLKTDRIYSEWLYKCFFFFVLHLFIKLNCFTAQILHQIAPKPVALC